ncbi:MAG: hypothetical protein NTZ33_06495 [Bacteroidetes bacterium]|nr:hypothetical protein [Bacteroidota bacterium]
MIKAKFHLIKKILLLFVFIPLLSFFSCKKSSDNEIIIQGIIIDANQHIPLANVEVTFWASRIQGSTYNPNYVSLIYTTTDANGYYYMKATKDKDAGYRITLDKSKYFSLTNDISVETLSPGTHQLNFSLFPEAFFKLIVKNTIPFNNNDFINYWFYNPQPSGLNCCNNSQISFTGQSYENTILCRTYGAQNMTVKWNVKKNNIVTLSEHSIYYTAFDTTTYNLNY